jgi:hypothetical protein
MRRTTSFQALNEAHVVFEYYNVLVNPLQPTQTFHEKFVLRISYRELDRQLPSLAQVLTSLFPSIYIVERLYIYGSRCMPLQWQVDIENMQWLEIFHPFTAVKELYVSEQFVLYIAAALQDLVGDRVTDALPALQSLFLEELQPSGPVQEAIGQFVAARQLLGHPVAVSRWNGTSVTTFNEYPPSAIPSMFRVI